MVCARRLLLLAAALALVLGCSSNRQRAEVSGTVTLDSVPVEEGLISFIPDEGNTGPESGGRIDKGKYHISSDKGVTVGKNRVVLRSIQKTGRKIQDPTQPAGTL